MISVIRIYSYAFVKHSITIVIDRYQIKVLGFKIKKSFGRGRGGGSNVMKSTSNQRRQD